MSQPRGIRNCNPGNIRITNDKWKGLRRVQEDKSFFQFVDMRHGYRALIICLQNYNRKHGCRTIEDYIRRWAPEHENNTSAYITSVCQKMQIPDSYVPDINDKDTMCAFAAAISEVENGVPVQMADVRAGWDLI